MMDEIIAWNLYNRVMASYTHMALSYKQLVDSLVYYNKDLLIGIQSRTMSSALLTIVESLAVPTSNFNIVASVSTIQLSTAINVVPKGLHQVDMSVCEPIMQSLYSLLYLIQCAAASTSNDASNQLFITDADQLTSDNYMTLDHFQLIVNNLVQLIVSTCNMSTSLIYRIALYQNFLLLLQYIKVTPKKQLQEKDVLLLEYQEILMVCIGCVKHLCLFVIYTYIL